MRTRKNWGADDREVAYWLDVGVPLGVAIAQAAWERRKMVVRMRNLSMTYKQIGAVIGRSTARVMQIIWKNERMIRFSPDTAPVALWLSRPGELHDLRRSMRAMKMIDQLASQRDWLVL